MECCQNYHVKETCWLPLFLCQWRRMLTAFLYLVSFYQNITYCPICNISTCLPGQTWPPALSIFLSVVHLMQMFCTCSVTRHSNKRRHAGPLAPVSLVWRPSQGHWSERDGAVLSTLSLHLQSLSSGWNFSRLLATGHWHRPWPWRPSNGPAIQNRFSTPDLFLHNCSFSFFKNSLYRCRE